MNSYKGLHEKNVSVVINSCQQLSKVHFSSPKMLDFLNSKLGWVADTNQKLIAAIRMGFFGAAHGWRGRAKTPPP